MSDIQLLIIIERYLNDEMTEEERFRFEALRRENDAVNSKVLEHKHFTRCLNEMGERIAFENRLNSIHDEIDIHALKEEFIEKPMWIVELWRNHHSKISVAASVAIFAIASTLFLSGYFNTSKQISTYSALRREVASIKRSQNALIRDVKSSVASNSVKEDPSHFGGTGFALSPDGYIATNYHVINGADSVYVQNAEGISYKAKTIYINPAYDIAVLQVIDDNFSPLAQIPYTFKKSTSDLGEDVYTLGYPKDEAVYGKGYLSSATGYNGDTVAYQVSIPVNPGNSGGPLLDAKGNVIGMISGKQTQADGAAFAIKSNYILDAIEYIDTDSLHKKLTLSSKNYMSSLNRTQQIKKLHNYVFMIKVY
jgi:serine protease Do